MSVGQPILAAWRAPALVWPVLRRKMGLLVWLRLHRMARLEGTRLILKGAVRQEHAVRIQGRGTLELDQGVVLGSTLAGAPGQPILLQPRFQHTKISLGRGAHIMNGCQLIAFESIAIGAQSAIGPGCLLMDHDGHALEAGRRRDAGKTAPILIEENVWLGARVTILKGVRVGRDAIVGAGAVVSKSVANGDIVVGNPARRIGSAYA